VNCLGPPEPRTRRASTPNQETQWKLLWWIVRIRYSKLCGRGKRSIAKSSRHNMACRRLQQQLNELTCQYHPRELWTELAALSPELQSNPTRRRTGEPLRADRVRELTELLDELSNQSAWVFAELCETGLYIALIKVELDCHYSVRAAGRVARRPREVKPHSVRFAARNSHNLAPALLPPIVRRSWPL